MATQPVQKQDDARKDAVWRILAEEAAQEEDPDKLFDIVTALNKAFDEEEARKKSA